MSRRCGQSGVGVALLCLLCTVSASIPPKITEHPPTEIAYKIYEKVDLPCTAVGDPSPSYKWTKNGADVVLNSEVYLTGGALTITYPKNVDEGLYQCIATSSYGIAVSVKTNLKLAMMDAFGTLAGPPPVREPVIGDALTLECNPPKSYPTGVIYWATTDHPSSSSSQGSLKPSDSSMFTPILSDARVTTDYDGFLRFANVVAGDNKNDQLYSCMVHNSKLRSFVQGDDQVLKPVAAPAGWLRIANVEAGDLRSGKLYICIHNNQFLRTFGQGGDQIVRPKPGPSGGPFPKATAKVWNSPSPNVVLVDNIARMKCIFKGYPTPQVSWTRVSGGAMPASAKILSSGMELAIPNVAYEDAGTYRCTGTNSAGSATTDIVLQVQSAPVFTMPAEDASPLEGDDASFRCEARGEPTPTITWSLNGKPLSEWKADDRRLVSPDMSTLLFKGVKKADTMVLQCNASNTHGYSFDNAVLNVIWQEPSIVEAPQVQVRVVIGKSVTFRCRVFGAPRPALSWQRDDNSIPLSTGVAKNGFNTTFTIQSATKADAGKYSCFAENIYGQRKATSELIVRDRTQIADPPLDQTVNVTQTAKFPCGVIVDAAERHYLKVKWYRDGVELRTGAGSRYTVDGENSLIISNTAVADSGNFKCGAVTDLDSAEGSADLIVKDKPDPPHSVHVSCQAAEIVVTWEEGSDNNDPIREYIVTYETNVNPGLTQEATRVPGRSSTSAVFDAIPFVTYTVSVVAVNGMGRSVSSGSQTCMLPPARPAKHPDGVCVESKEASKLIIVWTPMTKADLYGDGFFYTINYRRRDQPGARYITSIINDYQQRQFVVDDQPTMTEYEIYVEASNALGKANAQPKKMIGYSGEGKPLDRPNKLQTVSGSLNATSVVLQWEDVDRTPARVKGYFRGFRIIYWPTDDISNVQTQDVILSDVQLCRSMDPNSVYARRRRSVGSPVTNRLINLKPYKQYSATVSVLNLGQTSDASDPVTFITLEHVPSPVMDIRIPEKASHSLVVDWDPPAEPNGVIIGHEIIYQPANEENSGTLPKVFNVTDPTDTRERIRGLKPDTEYVVRVRSCTKVGCSQPITAQTGKTAPDGVPDEPIVAISTTENTMNVTWVPSGADPLNPGEAFQVKYREKGAADDVWVVVKAQPEDSHSLVVSNLKSGHEYEVIVVALDGATPPKQTPSKTHIVRVGTEKESVVAAASSAQWVIILLALLILLILIIVILLLIRYNRGQKYAVDEKEKLYGHRPDEQDEEGFGPYARPRAPPPPSNGPMPSEVGAPESDEEDELDVYDQMDASKFNEDGSFIGQYGGRKKGYDVSGGAGPSDHQRTHALSTFV